MKLRQIALVFSCAATIGVLWNPRGCNLVAQEPATFDAEAVTQESQPIAMCQLAVYLPVASRTDAIDIAGKAVAKHAKEMTALEAWPKPGEVELPFVVVAEIDTAAYGPPSPDAVKHFGRGLDEKQTEWLQDSQKALTLSFVYSREAARATLQIAYATLGEIARETDGLIWDEQTRMIYSPEAWGEKLVDAAKPLATAAEHTTIHAYRNGEHIRAITLGMSKFGLPDVVVETSPGSANSQVGLLMNLFCQRLVEGAEFESPGKFELELKSIEQDELRKDMLGAVLENGKGVVRLTLRAGRRDEGDPENDLIELRFDEYEGPDEFAKQELALTELFGSKEEIIGVEHNEKIEAASEAARAKLSDLQKGFDAGLKSGELLLVKAPFKTADGDREFMWVEVSSWKGDEISGTLQNEPFNVPDLKAGQKVTVSQAEVFDYLLSRPDGTEEGNETMKLILESQK
ncbi:DUF2314 domain-containing protein [Lacipirellula sp.]|uniref:DUF2314 domain-containing protein n=1 Tax=Lacipirellula sp. TaxID=2691419 RepID=UPI003D149D96